MQTYQFMQIFILVDSKVKIAETNGLVFCVKLYVLNEVLNAK